ncbi:MAG: DUF4136 domain-containing protein [Myxococcota bacterium]
MHMVALMLLAGSTLADAARVQHDVDRGADFAAAQTFAFRPDVPRDEDLSPLTDKRLRDTIRAQLAARGLRESTDPDLWLSIDATRDRSLRVDHTGIGFGYGFGYRRRFGGFGSLGTLDTRVTTVQNATIHIDVWDAATEEPVWRGTLTDRVRDNPKRMARKIDKAVRKVFRRFPVEAT